MNIYIEKYIAKPIIIESVLFMRRFFSLVSELQKWNSNKMLKFV